VSVCLSVRPSVHPSSDLTADINIAPSIGQIFMKLGMNIVPAILCSPPPHGHRAFYPAHDFTSFKIKCVKDYVLSQQPPKGVCENKWGNKI
jgi:hypothetical protein